MLMVNIRKYYESVTTEKIKTERYRSLAVTPAHIHKDKYAHKVALLTLGNEIVSHIHNRPVPVVNYTTETASQKVET